ncbi:MAG: class I SAM-dependent methyltransferase [Gemmatimonadales bacterium]
MEAFLKTDAQVVRDPRDYWKATPHAEGYDRGRFSDPWGRLYRVAEERAIRRALQPLTRHGRVLDTACGTGRVTALLVKEGFAGVVGTDVSPAMMAVAKRRLPQIDFFQSDATQLLFDDDSFDAVTCIGLLMHLDAPTRVAVLKQLARVSRGPVVVQYGCVGAFLQLASWVTGRPAGAVRYPVVEAEMRQDLKRAGLQERARFWALRPLSSSVILSLVK